MELTEKQTKKVTRQGRIGDANVSVEFEVSEENVPSRIQVNVLEDNLYGGAWYDVERGNFSLQATGLHFAKLVFEIAEEQINDIRQKYESNPQ